ncbi:unnamed protein product [Mesocestoides corti]|uniref:FAD-binding PCMH-type domain-containing protein n=2 Tax=Mesocestoides corti TaxID=53468 RepID=A0A0R3UFM8_MESCO|nr:unnamed protein product [Mesocestoides corti]
MMEIDINKPFDPLLIQSLAVELQLRIGTLPKVDVYSFHLEACAGDIIQCLRVEPRSLSEISRTVRAARTMKLSVRGMGEASGSEKAIYVDRYTVLIDCCKLADKPRMELVMCHREGDNKDTPGLRVLAGVTITELINFMVRKKVELYQSPDMIPGIGTVVGNIVTASPGVYGPSSGALGGCLADEVISMRVVNSCGDLVEYSDPHKLEQYCANMGLLGVVYNVTLRYRELTTSVVQFEFQDWCRILNSRSINHYFRNSDLTELIYLPYNHLRSGQSLRHDWVPYMDEVIIRSTKRLFTLYDEDLSCAPRHYFHIIDPVMGPDQRQIASFPEEGDSLIGKVYKVLKNELSAANMQTQYTPWAMTCLAPFPSPVRMLRFAIETCCTMDPFFDFMRTFLEMLMQMVRNEENNDVFYGTNLCIRVNFTGGNRTAKLLGVGSLNPTEDVGRRLIAHITFASLVRPGISKEWRDFSERITNFTFGCIPRSSLHWKTEWHTLR